MTDDPYEPNTWPETPEESPDDRKRRSWSPLVYLAGIVLVAGLIYQFAGQPSLPTVTTLNGQPGWVGTSDEPVADAAEVIRPSVVFLQVPSGVGSGVIYRSDGHIITAAHVVRDLETVMVRFSDGTQAVGEVLGSVVEVDIAVVKVDRQNLPAATFSTVKPRVGQMAVAVGSPWGLAQSVTAGIISAIDQTNCNGEVCAAMVQTDAAINPGNSGGALIDRLGQVVGINVSILTITGANDGVGFAVPSAMAVSYADAIISGEPLQTAFLGVRITNVTSGERAGALITEIFTDTGAENAGLLTNDLIVAVEGVPILTGSDLQAQIRTHRPGSTIMLLVVRGNQEVLVEVTLGVRAEDL